MSATRGNIPWSKRVGCAWPGCDSTDVTPIAGRPLCTEHRHAFRRSQRGDNATRRPGRQAALTTAQISEIRRRMARLESPKAIAADIGITVSTVHKYARKLTE